VKLDPGAHVFYAFGFALKSGCDNPDLASELCQIVRGGLFFTWRIISEVGKTQDLSSKIWQTLGDALFEKTIKLSSTVWANIFSIMVKKSTAVSKFSATWAL
jgi:hypothetical protein